ncbi:MAG: glycogen debranching enzyme GlgX, partial [Reyranella sp.]|nr:glycogen debranching enzyme GlgX [Reyranella sp.]
IIMNSHTDTVPFTLPEAVGGSRWVRLIDTSDPDGEPLALRDFRHAYDVPTRSLLLFVLQPTRTPQRSTAAERSFQRVVQAMDDASTKAVKFGFE